MKLIYRLLILIRSLSSFITTPPPRHRVSFLLSASSQSTLVRCIYHHQVSMPWLLRYKIYLRIGWSRLKKGGESANFRSRVSFSLQDAAVAWMSKWSLRKFVARLPCRWRNFQLLKGPPKMTHIIKRRGSLANLWLHMLEIWWSSMTHFLNITRVAVGV